MSSKDVYILQIETATTNCSVAISQNGETIALKEISNGFSHAENLHVFIESLMQEHAIDFKMLSAIAVSKGPGSYTGLRIGVSAAKGLCFVLDIPLIAIDTLTILAHNVTIDNGFVVPMLDARRMEAYTQVQNSQYEEVRKIEAQVITEDSFSEFLKKSKVTFVGNAVDKTKTVISNQNASFTEESLPSADKMSSLAYHKYKISDIEDVAYFEPFYLKDFVTTPPKNI